MATPTNFYKNPSNAYNKQFNLNSVLQNLQSYNIATGNSPSDKPATIVQRKRRRESRPPPPPPQRNEARENDGPMSHHEYIQKRRKEADSSQPYEELNADVLECSSSGFNLVGYESDTSTCAEFEEDRGFPRNTEEQLDSSIRMHYFPISEEESDRIKSQSEQRYPAPGEPVCIVCGKYGEYICNETNDDICSIECKAQVLQRIELPQESQSVEIPVGPVYTVPESGGDTWDYDRHCWSKKISGLCTYECWKCEKPGHLAEDCLVSTSRCESSAAGKTYNNISGVQDKSNTISRGLLDLYKRCNEIGKNFLAAKCSSCRGSTSLATCISCNNTFCDWSLERAYNGTSISSTILFI